MGINMEDIEKTTKQAVEGLHIIAERIRPELTLKQKAHIYRESCAYVSSNAKTREEALEKGSIFREVGLDVKVQFDWHPINENRGFYSLNVSSPECALKIAGTPLDEFEKGEKPQEVNLQWKEYTKRKMGIKEIE